MHRYLERHIPCPDEEGCGSSDACSTIEDDEGVHQFCFSCEKRFEVDDDYKPSKRKNVSETLDFEPTEAINQDYRSISEETLKSLGIKKVSGKNQIVYPYFSYDKEVEAQKIRIGKKANGAKDFAWRGPAKECGLFLSHLFPKGTGKKITVTTGENDAIAIIEMMGNFPTVSLKDGDGSVKRLSPEDYEYLNSFGEIIVCFDNDKSGREAMEKFVSIFPAKAKVVELPKGYKDAHQMLEEGQKEKFVKSWWNPTEFRPNNIVFPTDIKDSILNPPKHEIIPYPWESLNSQIFGLHTPEVITILAEPKVGKTCCADTKIINYDGRIIRYGDVTVGTKLLGPDGNPRTVTRVWKSKGPACKVTLKSGYSFICKHNHDLWVTNRNTQQSRKEEASVFFNRSENSLDKDRLTFSEGVDVWSNETVPLYDTYLFGLWLGDGTAKNSYITNMDEEVINYCLNAPALEGERVSLGTKKGTEAKTIRFVSDGKDRHSFYQALDALNVLDNKHIPDNMKFSSKENRLKLLAGLIDSDGFLQGGNSYSYEITQKNKVLSEDIAFVARSLGFQTVIREVEKTCTNNGVTGTYYRISIQGDISIIPVLIERKRPKRDRKKSHHMTTFKVEDLGYEKEFVSFELDGDHLYLHENFLIDHNSLFTAVIANHVWKTTDEKVADISVENTPDERARTLLSIHMGKPLHLTLAGEDIGVSKSQVSSSFDEYFQDRRIILFEKDGLTDPMEIMGKIDYFIEVLGCKYIIFDHINYLTSYHSDDERKTLDKLSNMLVDKAKDKRINMMIVSHVNDEGKTFGSRNLIKASHTVISLTRDRSNPNENIRNLTELKVTESRRYGSRIGMPIYLKYKEDSYSWTEIDPELVEEWRGEQDLLKE